MSAQGLGGRRIAGAVLAAIGTALVASVIVFTAVQFVPGDPAAEIAGMGATPEQVLQVRHNLGLDRPAWVRYGEWLWGALQGDFGMSIYYRQSVWSLLSPRIATTLLLDLYSTILVAIFGISLGILATRVRWANGLVTVLTGTLIGLPSFVAAVLLIQLFAVQLRWFPAIGAGGPDLGSRLHSLTLPAFALALAWSAFLGQIARASLQDQARREHVETARGRGLPESLIFWRHVFRNGSIPIVTVVSLTAGGLIAGSIVVERAFAIDGIGTFLVKSVVTNDAPVVLTIVMILVLIFIAVTTVADLAQWALDPRARIGSST
jgi:peptide/nickel transport system permease protein